MSLLSSVNDNNFSLDGHIYKTPPGVIFSAFSMSPGRCTSNSFPGCKDPLPSGFREAPSISDYLKRSTTRFSAALRPVATALILSGLLRRLITFPQGRIYFQLA